jgi:SAM-dependent methyltransferase
MSVYNNLLIIFRSIIEHLQDQYSKEIYIKRPILPRKLNTNKIFSFKNFNYFKDFIKAGMLQKKILIKYAKLNQNSLVLDVGCGGGKLAYALRKFLKKKHYFGFDVEKKTIDYLQKKFDFEFKFLNIQYLKNKNKINASQINLDYKENFFDVITSFSIFTHQSPIVLNNYLRQFYKFLKPGGLTLNTFYLIDPDNCHAEYAKSYGYNPDISNNNEKYYLEKNTQYLDKEKIIHHDIFYNINFISNCFKDNGFELVYYDLGIFSGKKSEYGTQDFLVHKKI